MSKLKIKKIAEAADLLKTLSGSFRMEIICLLCSNQAMTVTEITQQLKSEQSATSHQLAKLRADKIVQAQKDGQTTKYQLAKTAEAKLAKKIITNCDCLK
jgi:ArsR family transcriptional regulator